MARVVIEKTPYAGVFTGRAEIFSPIISTDFLIHEDGEVDFYTPLSRKARERLQAMVNRARKQLKGEGEWVR